MNALRLPDPEQHFDDYVKTCAHLLDNDPGPYEKTRTSIIRELRHGAHDMTHADEFACIECLHNALRRLIPPKDWNQFLDRPTMVRNLAEILRLSAHLIRLDRDGRHTEPTMIVKLCNPQGEEPRP